MSKSESSLPVQIREQFFENKKLSFGLSVASLTISTIILIIALCRKPQLPAYAKDALPGEPITFETLCLDCVQLLSESQYAYFSEPLLNNLHVKIKDGRRQCCFNNTYQLNTLITLLLKNENERQESTPADTKKILPTQTVAAHKKLLPSVEKDDKFPGDHTCLKLDVNNVPHESTNGVTVTPHSLVIKFSGLYYIYCSIRFHQDDNTAKITNSLNVLVIASSLYLWESDEFLFNTGTLWRAWMVVVVPPMFVTYMHRISPYNPGGTGWLLKSVHTAFYNTSETTFTGGIFLLREGDRIQVCVINPTSVDFRSESTYTGLLLLASHAARDDAFSD